jgi:NAD(P)-dependent dehydrogenase (short-subunit alcohol dehydrogenase family)
MDTGFSQQHFHCSGQYHVSTRANARTPIVMPAQREIWTLDKAPSLEGKVAVVTGANSGIGFHTALGLARLGATTILATRSPEKASQALVRIKQALPTAQARIATLDLASLDSVAHFASKFQAGVIDILVNNAGVMGTPRRQQTKDGFEQQIGVNYLAHFALTARLKDALCAAPGGGRVVNVASLAHRRARLQLDDLQSERSYRPMNTYAQSKLAMLIFAIELQRRAEQNGWPLRSVAAHPGWAKTEIINSGIGGGAPGLKAMLMDQAFSIVAQSASDGALPSLYAATAPDAKGGGYYGPAHFGETRGAPAPARIFPQAADRENAKRLWAISEKLTGMTFN